MTMMHLSDQNLDTKPVVPKHSTIVSNPPGYLAHYHCHLTSSHSPSSVKSNCLPNFLCCLMIIVFLHINIFSVLSQPTLNPNHTYKPQNLTVREKQ